MFKKIVFSTSTFNFEGNAFCDKLIELGFELINNPHRRRLTEGEAKELLSSPGVVGLIAGVEPLTKNVLSTAKDLRVIVRCGSGIDNVDLETCRNMGIVVRNTPNAPSKAVAEFAIGHLLNLMRHISRANEEMRVGTWRPILGSLLGSKTVGIIGYGSIGRRVGFLLKAFGARLMIFDPNVDQSSPSQNIIFSTLDELLACSDVIFLHTSYNLQNKYLINADSLRKMKPGSMLANFSRGGIVDEDALFDALKSNHLAGACIDVYEHEPYIGRFQELSNVILTPHMGSYAIESRNEMESEAVEVLISELVINK